MSKLNRELHAVAASSAERAVDLIKQHARRLKKSSVGIFNPEGISLHEAQAKAAKDVGFESWHELSQVAKRNPADRRFGRALRLMNDLSLHGNSFWYLDVDTIEAFRLLSAGDAGYKGAPRPVVIENASHRFSIIDEASCVKMVVTTPWSSERFTGPDKTFVIQKAHQTPESLSFEMRCHAERIDRDYPFHSFVDVNHIEIGDEVVYYEKENQSKTRNGTTGRVTSFESRVLPEEDGFYRKRCSPCVTWSDGSAGTPSTFSIGLLNQKDHIEIVRKRREELKSHPMEIDFVAPLPVQKYFRGDTLVLEGRNREMETLQVTHVDYRWGEVGYVTYSLKDPANPHAYHGSRAESEVLRCLERGNEYHWRNGKQLHLMHFDSPKAEVAFYVMVDEIHQVKSPRSGNYQWTWGDIQQAVAAGRSMAPRMSPGFFGAKPMLLCYEIPASMPELAEKVRKEFLAGNPEMDKMKQQAESPQVQQEEECSEGGGEHEVQRPH